MPKLRQVSESILAAMNLMNRRQFACIPLPGCQINQIDVNVQLQKSLEIFDTNSADKIQSQDYKGGKFALPHAK